MDASRATALLALVAALSGSAGCGSGEETSGASCTSGIGLGSTCSRPCVSWSYRVELGGCCCSDCVKLVPDLSTNPARATLRVGQRLMLGSAVDQPQPEGCNEGWDSRPSWTATSPAVLQLQRVEPATGFSTAVFLASATGTSTVVAELRASSGVLERVGLTVCAEERTTGLYSQCVKRVPLEIEVVP